jgi:hypothetical protein
MVLSTRVRVLLVVMAVVGMALGVIGVLGAVGSALPNNSDRIGSSAGWRAGIVGMEPGRSWSTCPLSSDLLPTLHQPADPSTLASDLRTGRVALSRQLWHVRADRY